MFIRSPPKGGDELNTGVSTVGATGEHVESLCFVGFGVGLFTQVGLREQWLERIGVNTLREHQNGI